MTVRSTWKRREQTEKKGVNITNKTNQKKKHQPQTTKQVMLELPVTTKAGSSVFCLKGQGFGEI